MTTEEAPVIDPADFRRVLGHLPTGVTVVTAVADDQPAGVAIGSFASISLDPPLVGFFLGTQSASGAVISKAGGFCVNILAADQLTLCGVMASKADDKFDGVEWAAASGSGAPILPDIVAYIDCSVEQIVEFGDHNLIVGRVLALDTASAENPMVFYAGQYGTFGPA